MESQCWRQRIKGVMTCPVGQPGSTHLAAGSQPGVWGRRLICRSHSQQTLLPNRINVVTQRLESPLAVRRGSGAWSLWGIPGVCSLRPALLESSLSLPTSAFSCLGPSSLIPWSWVLSKKPLFLCRKIFSQWFWDVHPWGKTNLPASSLVIV